MTTPVIDVYQFQFGDDGIILNNDDLPIIDVTSISGLDNATFRSEFKSTEGRDGGVVEADYEDQRTIVVGGNIYGADYADLDTIVDALKANFAPSRIPKPFYFKQANGNARVAYGKCTTGFRSDWDSMKRVATAKFQFTIQCGDPIIYGTQNWTFPGSLAQAPAPGFNFPFTFPFTFGDPTTGPGAFVLTNYGNRPAPWRATLSGDLYNPTFIDDASGEQLSLSIGISSTDILQIDFGKRTVTLNGASRRGAVDEETWFLLEPGDNTIHVLIDGIPGSGIGSGVVNFDWYDAWR